MLGSQTCARERIQKAVKRPSRVSFLNRNDSIREFSQYLQYVIANDDTGLPREHVLNTHSDCEDVVPLDEDEQKMLR